MNKTIIFLSFIFIHFNNACAQNIDSLLSKFPEINEKEYFQNYFATVYNYFDIGADISTPLKKSVYESTKEYKLLLDSLIKVKRSLRERQFIRIPISKDTEYDVKKGGIRVLMSSRFIRREVQGIINVYEPDPEEDSKYYFALTNILTTPEIVYPQLPHLAQRMEYIFIPMNKNLGLEFENSRSSNLYLLVRPSERTKTTIVENPVYRDTYECKYIYASVEYIYLTIDDKIVFVKKM